MDTIDEKKADAETRKKRHRLIYIRQRLEELKEETHNLRMEKAKLAVELGKGKS